MNSCVPPYLLRLLAAALLAAPALAQDQELPPAAPAKTTVVSVVAWQNRSTFGDAPWLAQAGADAIAAQLSSQPGVVVLEREGAATLEAEGDLAGAGDVGGRAARADLVIGGSFRSDGAAVAIDVRVVASGAGGTVWSGHQEGQLAGYSALCRSLARTCLAAITHGHGGGGEVGAGAAPPLAAAEAYFRGRRLFEHGECERAVAELLRAVRAGPGFAPAWDDLGAAFAACGHLGAARAAFAMGTQCAADDAADGIELFHMAQRIGDANPTVAEMLKAQVRAEHPFTYQRIAAAAEEARSWEDQDIGDGRQAPRPQWAPARRSAANAPPSSAPPSSAPPSSAPPAPASPLPGSAAPAPQAGTTPPAKSPAGGEEEP